MRDREIEDLFRELIADAAPRWADLEVLDGAMRGDAAPPYLPSQDTAALAQEYNELINRSQLNMLPLIVGSLVDRLSVTGFREAGEPDLTGRVWDWWQASSLDTRQQQIFTDAAVFGDSYVLVTPAGDVPTFSVESPLRLAVELDQVDVSRVVVAAKQVGDRGWLYTDTEIVGLERTPNWASGWKVVSRAEHAAGQCPIIRFGNMTDALGRSRSEIVDCLPVQARVQQTIFDRLLVQRSQAWRQRWIAGVSVERDPDTGEALPPFRLGADQVLVSADSDTKFGEFGQADLSRLLEAVNEDIRALALISRTPPHLLPSATISNVSAETIAALESGLESKVSERQRQHGESIEAMVRLGARMVGAPPVADDAEVVWGASELLSESQRVDAAIKLVSAGLPLRYVLTRLGLTQQEADRVIAEKEREEQQSARATARSFGLPTDAEPE